MKVYQLGYGHEYGACETDCIAQVHDDGLLRIYGPPDENGRRPHVTTCGRRDAIQLALRICQAIDHWDMERE